MEFALLVFLTILTVVNFIFLFAIGIFLVRFRDRVNKMFKDLIEAMEVMWGAVPYTESDSKSDSSKYVKTWDEKYEEELEAAARRLRMDSGLRDISDPVLSWGEPPALNSQNADGLLIKDISKTPMNVTRIDSSK